jgi:hypothetical protein
MLPSKVDSRRERVKWKDNEQDRNGRHARGLSRRHRGDCAQLKLETAVNLGLNQSEPSGFVENLQ